MNINVSPLCPINFTEIADIHSGELERTYVQQFLPTDRLVLQLTGDPDLIVVAYIGQVGYRFTENNINEFYSVYNIVITLSGLAQYELHSVEVSAAYEDEIVYFQSQSYFEIVECDNLKLITYFGSSINPFNTNFNGVAFYLRLPMGFKSTSITDNAVTEMFRNQGQKLRLLYAHPYQTKTLIIGDNLGVPNWIGTLINNIFCLSNVYIDGVRYIRGEDSVPERQDSVEGYPLHVYNMTVETWENDYAPETTYGDFNNDFNDDYRI